MDVDVNSDLLSALRGLRTNDKDELVQQFCDFLYPQNSISKRVAEFFLDMNNWNVQEALCSYYDCGNGSEIDETLYDVPNMTVVADLEGIDGQTLTQGAPFNRTWLVRNPGPLDWPEGCSLRCCEGESSLVGARTTVPALKVNDTTNLSLELAAPQQPGTHRLLWRLETPTNIRFGDPLWCIITVGEPSAVPLASGLLPVMESCTDVSMGASSSSSSEGEPPRVHSYVTEQPDGSKVFSLFPRAPPAPPSSRTTSPAREHDAEDRMDVL